MDGFYEAAAAIVLLTESGFSDVNVSKVKYGYVSISITNAQAVRKCAKAMRKLRNHVFHMQLPGVSQR
jgi:hypothetical protein